MDSNGVMSRETRNSEKRAATGGDSFLYSSELKESGLSTGISQLRRSSYCNLDNPFPAVPYPSLCVTESRILRTRPKLLRKKESELRRCKELLLKKSADCANAICGERFAVEREMELRRRLHGQKSEFEEMKRVERLRCRERLVMETERLSKERDEARIVLVAKDALVKRLKIRVGQLEQIEKQKDSEIRQMKRELETKNTTIKTLLRKLVLLQFSKRKSWRRTTS